MIYHIMHGLCKKLNNIIASLFLNCWSGIFNHKNYVLAGPVRAVILNYLLKNYLNKLSIYS